jgi:hypothetical protein
MKPAVTDSYLKAIYPPFDAFSRPFGGGRKDLETEPQSSVFLFCVTLSLSRHLPEAEPRAI